MSTFDDFYNQWNGKPCEVEDPSAPDQCMDLAFAWCDKLGIDRAAIRHQYAYQVWTMPSDTTLQYFDYVPNTPNGIPPEGALIIFNQNVGSAGHICIGTKNSTADSLISFDQNWSGVQYPRLITHAYTNVYGWLIPKTASTTLPNQTILDQSDAFIAVATKLNTAANRDLVLAEIDKLVTIEDQAPAKDKQLSDALSQVQYLDSQVQTLQKDHTDLQGQLADQAKTIQDQDGQIQALSTNITNLKLELQQANQLPTLSGWALIAKGIAKLFGGKG